MMPRTERDYMRPSVGRVVHFVMANGRHRPGLISGVVSNDPIPTARVHLTVFPVRSEDFPVGTPFEVENVVRDEGVAPKLGTWHEPERV